MAQHWIKPGLTAAAMTRPSKVIKLQDLHFVLNTHLEKFCESESQILVGSFLMSDGIVDEKKNKHNFSLL
jgi:hypothetical protein